MEGNYIICLILENFKYDKISDNINVYKFNNSKESNIDILL